MHLQVHPGRAAAHHGRLSRPRTYFPASHPFIHQQAAARYATDFLSAREIRQQLTTMSWNTRFTVVDLMRIVKTGGILQVANLPRRSDSDDLDLLDSPGLSSLKTTIFGLARRCMGVNGRLQTAKKVTHAHQILRPYQAPGCEDRSSLKSVNGGEAAQSAEQRQSAASSGNCYYFPTTNLG